MKLSNFKNNINGIISVIGASEISKDIREKTVEIGRLIAKNNYAIACGGLSGVMEAVCKGAKEEGGFTIGIIPSIEKTNANKYIDLVIPCPFSQARNIVVVLTGDVVLAISGKAGTLSEISFAWIYQKPIVALTEVDGWSSKIANQKLDDRRSDMIYGVKTPQEAINKINELFLKSGEYKDLDFIDKF
ncbi:MAG: TIGR00725 family protein [Candidatus Lokiarchaeia archaeon]|nr:TIGR00725 family protein [Candidatus Lokiarchaeia archaeon]